MPSNPPESQISRCCLASQHPTIERTVTESGHENSSKKPRSIHYVCSIPRPSWLPTTSAAWPHGRRRHLRIRAEHTSARVARAALDTLYQRQARVLGVVFNAVRASAGEYYYYRYKDYYKSYPPLASKNIDAWWLRDDCAREDTQDQIPPCRGRENATRQETGIGDMSEKTRPVDARSRRNSSRGKYDAATARHQPIVRWSLFHKRLKSRNFPKNPAAVGCAQRDHGQCQGRGEQRRARAQPRQPLRSSAAPRASPG